MFVGVCSPHHRCGRQVRWVHGAGSPFRVYATQPVSVKCRPQPQTEYSTNPKGFTRTLENEVTFLPLSRIAATLRSPFER